jgi:hypothetical protein
VGFQLVAPDLTRWDALASTAGGPPELLAAPFFADERPLRGAAGLVDWRMCGRLSRWLGGGQLSGKLGETSLLPARGLPFRKLLLVGLGSSDRFSEETFRRMSGHIARVLERLQVTRYALPLPGRSTGRIDARRALELWIDEAGHGAEVWIVEPPSVQKDLSEMLGKAAGARR